MQYNTIVSNSKNTVYPKDTDSAAHKSANSPRL